MYKSGDKIYLNKWPVYKNSVITEPKTEITGEFYVTNGMKVNNRIKISEEPSTTEFLGWVEIPTEDTLSEVVEEESAPTIEEMIAEPAFTAYKVRTSDTNRLNVRKTPSLEAAVVAVIPSKSELTVYDEVEDWGRIEEFPGWICLKFVTKM